MNGMALARAWKQMPWFYYQYLLVSALYMLEPWERTVFNSMLVSVVGMALYTGYVFMPQHIRAILHYFEIIPASERTLVRVLDPGFQKLAASSFCILVVLFRSSRSLMVSGLLDLSTRDAKALDQEPPETT
ncbi:PREDICTED: serine palmitoyltransferase small subunit A-like [Chrysochloris asiatica]|uniref:Serine palmitoyltransferase small subunit A-like n=1 Tax=Chrysochloris asiatica TaxID=185453 RepID=A0A9B0T928_CHRAS|nr:PREDICTED: serine palmitoyltransferase small subunit A-like [Chrysochloris asiatica]